MPNVTRLPDRKSGVPESRRRYRGIAIGPRGERETKIFPRKDLALAWAVRREEELRRGTGAPRPSAITLGEYALSSLEGMRIAPGTRRNYERYIENYLVPAFGKHRLSALRLVEVEAWLDRLVTSARHGDVRPDRVGRAVKPATAASILGAFKAVLRQAVREGLLPQSPLIGTRAPAIPDSHPRFMAEADARRVIDALPAWARTLALLLLYTGLRPGEARALVPEHLDLDRGMVLVRGTIAEDDGCGFDWSPLTKGKRHRDVPLPSQVVAALRSHVLAVGSSRQEVLVGDGRGGRRSMDLVFRGPNGGPVCRHDLLDAWLAATEAVGAPRHRVYDLRHTYASMLASAGHSLSEIGELLGHGPNSKATAVYARLMPAYRERVRAALERDQ